ncbi:ABC transporter ATP-binding protein [Flavobacterium sp. 7A]|uniref:ABC transporter ATP-binding protein n=1 Tax=Flavobacterium sp. 7A TaxID=2940571 RepID=UPI002227D20B|nr:ABC transporter ATP-binding protein [Flavobacterium sp. 7A]MCW2119334.1 NitT/TauT family transport system ATP-binding protein [Flavobacterium sp. 7A]
MESKYILELKDIKQEYLDQTNQSFTVLTNINIKIREGEFVTIVGPTGCGKSTLLRMILGSEKPSNGKVLMEGKQVDKPDRDRGVVFQKYSLFDNLTVRDNVRIGLELENHSLWQNLANSIFPNWKLEDYNDLVHIYLKKVNLQDHADKFPHQLSGGMRQRVAIAQAMIMKPKVLLMDEPFGALDAGTKEQMHAFMLEQWKETGQTILFVTHDLEEAIYLGTRVIVLSQYYNGANGAKIVKDLDNNWTKDKGLGIKDEPQFLNLVKTIRNEGLTASNVLEHHHFELTHQDHIINQ